MDTYTRMTTPLSLLAARNWLRVSLRTARTLVPHCAAVAVAMAAVTAALGAAPASAGSLAAGDSTALLVAQAGECRNCGVVQSVVVVQRQGQARGIAGTQVTPGMAIGGVVGGLLGNQVGHGNGRAAATVIGAAGGAYAGNAIEKNRVRYTAYVMHIRMRDGSMRTIEQRNSIARGTHVVVEGNSARVTPARG
ncbi:MAG: 17 kDa surface antigen [Ramlibacter sp.]|nr:17 kDa surface antigen [Ramlibacter sp.]